MVVLTIIAVVTGVMVLEMGGTYEDALLRTNARKLIDVCNSASNRAIAVGRPQVLRVDTKSGRFVVRPKAQELGEHDETITEGELDTRIGLTIREPQRDEEELDETDRPVSNPSDAITFYPDGSADGREFLLRDRAGVELLLRMNPTTSRVRVIEMASQ
jgi:type II secretion system protein H